VLAVEDSDVYTTAPAFIATRTSRDLDDYLEFTVQAPAGRDSVAILLRLRNSLLNTVLLYEEILAGAGPRALDWMGQDLNRISTALELGEWYTRHMGMRVEVIDGEASTHVTRIFDVGPIAFHDVVALVPVGVDGTARVRLSFVADNWRIDRLAYSSDFRRAQARIVPLSDAYGVNGEPETAAFRSLSQPDEDYLVTGPGQRFTASFDVGGSTPAPRTFFIASQGYYIEWMRPEWLRQRNSGEPFAPSADRIYSALTRWSAKREAFEQQFYASRIPMR
jgi:broad specificity phosphatase PhoE